MSTCTLEMRCARWPQGSQHTLRLRTCATPARFPKHLCRIGLEFDSAEVREFCGSRGIKLHFVPACSPWVSGVGGRDEQDLVAEVAEVVRPGPGRR